MARIITAPADHPQRVKVDRWPGHPPVITYSTAMDPGTVLRQAMHDLDNDEAVELARALGMLESA